MDTAEVKAWLDAQEQLLHDTDEALRASEETAAQVPALTARIATLEALLTEADPAYIPGWDLVWRDEFTQPDGPPDPAKWRNRPRSVMGVWASSGEIPTPAQITVRDGALHNRADWLPKATQRALPSPPLTHAAGYMDHARRGSETAPIFEQARGRWEVGNVLTPTGVNTLGILCAPMWWLPASGQGEIDWEIWGGKNGAVSYPGTATMTVHFDRNADPAKGRINNKRAHTTRVINSHLEPATFATEFTDDYFAGIVNGVEEFRWTPTDHPWQEKWGSLPAREVCPLWDDTIFGGGLTIRSNIHVGPNRDKPGWPDPAHPEYTKDIDMRIGHFRIWAPQP